jgi:molybdate transport system ATP-binding protein
LSNLLAPHHFIRVYHRLGGLQVDASFALSAPWTVLFGASGSGKTSILRAIAGLLRPAQGSILRQTPGPDPSLIHLTDTVTRTFVPPHLRNIRYAPQRASLFPHLTVQQNVAYGAREDASAAVAEVIALFALEPFAHKLPATLSGGERQRVNLARAVAASDCRLLLLDEPFNGLDHRLRDVLLPRLQAWLAAHEIPVLSVTHDVVEALQLHADLISIQDGRATAQGPAHTLLVSERTRLLTHLG